MVMAKKVKARFIEPMLLLRTDALPGDRERWQYELKVDGYRAIAFKTGGKLHLRSRNNYDFTKRYPDVLRGLGKLPNETVIDGEIVAFDADGRPSFNSLQNFASAETSIVYYVTQVNRRCEGEAGRTDEMYGRLHLPARLVPRHEDVAQPPSLRQPSASGQERDDAPFQ